ncbi:MAG: hypothetical protein WCI97_01590 [Bacteroidota bacterium]
MKTIFSISILAYFFLGSMVLPQGDFSVLPQLPKMYQHCKSVEDADMNLVDFVFDHLMGIDGSFDQHENGDHEKPHSTTPFQHQQHQSVYNSVTLIFSHSYGANENFVATQFSSVFYSGNFSRCIFHPPSL